jgi:hypothetical protein
MLRASIAFLALAGVVLGTGTVARDLLGLGCVGPVLPAWGCLAVPYPDTLPSGFTLYYYAGLAGAAWLACYAVRNPLFFLGNWLLRLAFPGWMRELKASQAPARSYKIR